MRHIVHPALLCPDKAQVLAWAAMLSLLVTGLSGCDSAAQQDPTIAAATHASVPAAPHKSGLSTFEADDARALAIAEDQAARAARQHTLSVQRKLVEQRRATRDAVQRGDAAAQRGDTNERCISGQKMRRVTNGWVQDGAC